MKMLLSLLIFLISAQISVRADSISLDDLGFQKTQTESNPELQKTLEKRSSMLKTHQVLALVTAAPMIANYFLGDEAGHSGSTRNAHAWLGATTASLYFTSASFAIFAPKPDGIEDQGNTRIHRALAWVHAPLMIITPILGTMAKNQIESGHRHVTGIVDLHGAAATTLLISYLASIAVMSFNF